MSKKVVAVIFGGRSAEHDVSIVTAIVSIIKPLKITNRYEIIPVYISKDGGWYSDPAMKNIDFFSKGNIEDKLADMKQLKFSFEDGLQLIWNGGLKSKSVKVDVVFPAMHGTYGEDGSLMGMLRMANVPYVGCDMTSSVVAMDKVLCKQVAESTGILTPKSVWFYKREFENDQKAVLKKISTLKYPVFVKPAHLGSSIGVTPVHEEKDLLNALEVAVHYDDKILAEQGVNNLVEVTVPIMGNNVPVAALVEESIQSDEEGFYDFVQKYINDGGKKGKTGGKSGDQLPGRRLPAKLPEKLYMEAEEVALQTYKAIGCSGTSRVDLLIDEKNNKVYMNEVNTLPGSLFAHNWKRAGVSNVELAEQLIHLAEERHQELAGLSISFSTNFLSQF